MPELPDVESFRRYLNRTSLHQRIAGVSVRSAKILRGITPQRLARRLVSHDLRSTQRQGKWLFAKVDASGWLALHFGMTAFLRYTRHLQRPLPHDRLLIRFTNGAQLAFDDQRLFGRITFAGDLKTFITQQRLGPDALTIDWREFQERLANKRQAIKSVLMDQTVLAGIGNLYADEILFQSRIHPLARTDALPEQRLRAVYITMRQILKEALKRQANPTRFPRTWLFGNRMKKGRCPRCGGPLTRLRSAQRSAYFCPRCQRLSRR